MTKKNKTLEKSFYAKYTKEEKTTTTSEYSFCAIFIVYSLETRLNYYQFIIVLR